MADFNGDQLTDIIEIGNQELATGPTPFSITCDRGASWQVTQGMLPEGAAILRPIDLDADGRSELVSRVDNDVVIFQLQ